MHNNNGNLSTEGIVLTEYMACINCIVLSSFLNASKKERRDIKLCVQQDYPIFSNLSLIVITVFCVQPSIVDYVSVSILYIASIATMVAIGNCSNTYDTYHIILYTVLCLLSTTSTQCIRTPEQSIMFCSLRETRSL